MVAESSCLGLGGNIQHNYWLFWRLNSTCRNPLQRHEESAQIVSGEAATFLHRLRVDGDDALANDDAVAPQCSLLGRQAWSSPARLRKNGRKHGEKNAWQKEIAGERPRLGLSLAWRFVPFPHASLSWAELLIGVRWEWLSLSRTEQIRRRAHMLGSFGRNHFLLIYLPSILDTSGGVASHLVSFFSSLDCHFA
jgi:hypothetical protein